MGPNVIPVAFFASIAWIAWAAAYAWTHRPSQPQREPEFDALTRANRLEERLERIEQSMQAMAVEIERLGEGQRFTTKLLTERTAPGLVAPREREEYRRADTPH